MSRLISILFLLPAIALPQQVGPISGGAGTVKSFTFQNGNGFNGTVTNPQGNVILSLSLTSQAITLDKLANITQGQILGRKDAGPGQPEAIQISDALDFTGNTRGSMLFRGASGWTILAPTNNTDILVSQGAGADPHFIADVNEKTANKGASNGYAALFGGTVPLSQMDPTIELTTRKTTANGYPSLNGSALVPVTQLGTGSTGGGTKALFDNNTWQTLSGGGSVSTFTAGNLSPLFTSSVATATTTPALTFTLSNAAGFSWFGNATGSSAAPAFNTSVFPASLMPAFTGDVTNTAGTLATTISAAAVSYAKIQNVAAKSLLGNPTGSSASALEIALDGSLQFISSTLYAYGPTQAISAFAIDASTGTAFSKTLGANANTFTWSNFRDGETISVRLKQVHTGTVGTVVFPSTGCAGAGTTKWQGGTQPVQSTGNDISDRYILQCDGNDVYAFATQNY